MLSNPRNPIYLSVMFGNRRGPPPPVAGPSPKFSCSRGLFVSFFYPLLVAEYIDFLRSVSPDNQEEFLAQLRRFNLGAPGEADCPVFDGMFDYFQLYTGGSVDAAALVNAKEVDLAFNWMGGMHHAKRAEASGFCYINDIVLCILELLKEHARVLYVDIDIHHGDGVEEAFYLTDRVMTVSFHKYGDFFPGTGALGDIGCDEGRFYSVNGPLLEGVDDDSYHMVFKPVMQKVMELYQPGAIVVCAGADSLSGDRLGCFNLSIEGHSHAVEFLQSFGVPVIMLGGGGYTMRNVARCWTYETARMIGEDLSDDLPEQAMAEYNYYMDTGKLRIQTSNMRNANTKDYLNKLRIEMLKNLSKLPSAPSAQMRHVPDKVKPEDEPEVDPDERGGGQLARERRIARGGTDGWEDDEPGSGDRYEYNPRSDPQYGGVARPADLAAGAAAVPNNNTRVNDDNNNTAEVNAAGATPAAATPAAAAAAAAAAVVVEPMAVDGTSNPSAAAAPAVPLVTAAPSVAAAPSVPEAMAVDHGVHGAAQDAEGPADGPH